MVMRLMLLVCALGVAAVPLAAQPRVDMRNTHERLICVVPIVGKGTPDDPRRPLFAPLPGKSPAADGIIAYSFQASDDGRFALVEFVARDRAGFKDILEDRRPEVKVFVKGVARRQDIEAEFRKHKKDFDLDRLGVSLP
ncbi:MAG: hypothetical protein FJW34_26745 [Acidobacteria bacterium]|nr:hypothetical protein [Acidobacteriota bacterium]